MAPTSNAAPTKQPTRVRGDMRSRESRKASAPYSAIDAPACALGNEKPEA